MQTTVINSENIKQEQKGANNIFKDKSISSEGSKKYKFKWSWSSKETRHIELSLEGSGLSYIPGDALGIVPHNDPN